MLAPCVFTLLVILDFGHLVGAPIDPSRMPAAGWTGNVGVPGGIPTNYTMFCNVKVSNPNVPIWDPAQYYALGYSVLDNSPGGGGGGYRCLNNNTNSSTPPHSDPTNWAPFNLLAVGDGVADDAPAINCALQNCPDGQYIYIPTGSYRLNSAISKTGINYFDNVQHPYSILIKGNGPANTKLYFYGAGTAISLLPAALNARTMPVASGNTRGSTSLVVGSIDPYLAVNTYVVVNRLNSEAITDRTLGASEMPGGYMTNTASQIVKVTNISGNTLTITPALNEGYASDYVSIGISAPYRSGIQDLYIENKTNNGGHNILIQYGQECWVKNVESNMASKWHIRLQASARCEVRECYMHDGWDGGGDSIYGVGVFQYSCNNLVEDNIAERCRHAYITEYGGQNNVFGYNYSKDPINGDHGANPTGIQGGSPGQLATDYLMGDTIHHGGEPRYNLFEGNVSGILRLDDVLGGSRYATAFRNHFLRKGLTPTIVANFGTDIQQWNYYANLVGNEYEAPPAGATAGLRRWGSDGDNPNPVSGGPDPRSQSTALIDGETEIATATTTWAGADHSLVNSYYLTAKPAWFGTLAWPAFDPTTAATNSATNIPGGYRRINGTPPPTAPFFLGQLADTTVVVGANATFTAAVDGYPTPSLQWQKNNVNLPGETGSSLVLTSVALVDSGSTYRVVATNASGTVTGNSATLTVVTGAAPVFSLQPASQAVTTGTTVVLTSAATGAPAPTFQWQKNGSNITNGSNISGATTNTLTLTAVTGTNAGSYTVVATNVVASTPSSAAVLTVTGTAPVINTQPVASQTVLAGASVSFTVAASGTGTLTYQWKKGGVNLGNGGSVSGATTATLTLTGVTSAADVGSYTVLITNALGSLLSTPANLTVLDPPMISAQPVSVNVVSGHIAKFQVTVSNGSTYQWQIAGNGSSTWTALSDGSSYSGTSTATLTVANAQAGLNGSSFRVIITGAGGTVTSAAATLSVAAVVLVNPVDVALAANGNLFVSDYATNVIQSINASGVASVFAGYPYALGSGDGIGTGALFLLPTYMVVGPGGNLFVTDSGNGNIRRITPDGVVTTVAGSAANQGYRDGAGTGAWFNSPFGIGADTAGNLYVADTGNSVIRKITPDGTVTTLAGMAKVRGSADGTGASALFNQPTGIAVDGNGIIYVSDSFNQTIRSVTPAGIVTTLAGMPGVVGFNNGKAANALFNYPQGLAVDGSGNVYVADTGNSTIRVIRSGGTVATLAGQPLTAGLKDGTGANAWFNQPTGLRLDGSGNLYVVDSGNATIRRVSLDGVVTTLSLSQSPVGPSTATAPSPKPTTPPPAPSPKPSSGGGGGGGAVSPWFLGALALLVLVRRAVQAARPAC